MESVQRKRRRMEVLTNNHYEKILDLFDEDCGVLGSANFTAGGFKSNIELSLLMGQKDNILTELHSYFDELLSKIKQSDNYEN
jgi:hypothetical protein